MMPRQSLADKLSSGTLRLHGEVLQELCSRVDAMAATEGAEGGGGSLGAGLFARLEAIERQLAALAREVAAAAEQALPNADDLAKLVATVVGQVEDAAIKELVPKKAAAGQPLMVPKKEAAGQPRLHLESEVLGCAGTKRQLGCAPVDVSPLQTLSEMPSDDKTPRASHCVPTTDAFNALAPSFAHAEAALETAFELAAATLERAALA